MNKTELSKAAEKLAKIYRLSDENPRAIDPNEKERLYILMSRWPEIHYAALKINNMRNRGR